MAASIEPARRISCHPDNRAMIATGPAVCIRISSVDRMVSRVRRFCGSFVLSGLFTLVGVAGCGNSSTANVAGPSFTRCTVSISGSASTISADGGNGSLSVSVDRECLWTARAESWISLSTDKGQGTSTLTYSVQPNPAGLVRRGAIVVEEQRMEIIQSAAPCRYNLTPASVEMPAGGGGADVTVEAPAGCAWTARGSAAWITVDPGSGTGAAKLHVSVEPNGAGARSASITVDQVMIAVQQSSAGAAPPECRYQSARRESRRQPPQTR
jgi:hypothetical protein